MLTEDQERLEREAAIAKANQGPDYAWLETSINRNKAKAHELANLQAEMNARSRIPPMPEGISEDVIRRASITAEHENRKGSVQNLSHILFWLVVWIMV